MITGSKEAEGAGGVPWRWAKLIIVGAAVLAVEAIWTKNTGINPRLRTLGGTVGSVAGLTSVFSWLLFPFLLFSICVLLPKTRWPGCDVSSPGRLAWKPAARHAICFAAFALQTLFLNRSSQSGPIAGFMVFLWLFLGAACVATLGIAILPLPILSQWKSAAWVLGLAVAFACLMASRMAQTAWNSDANLAIDSVRWVLRQLGFHALATGDRLGTGTFSVWIAPSCSGYEGMGLMLAFSVAWLAWFRKQYRFPAALMLLPIGVALSWTLNIARLVLLILIGHSGYREIAIGGFHSQAGWIGFTLLAVGFCAFSSRIPGIRIAGNDSIPRSRDSTPDPAVVYLAPFLAMQAAAMISVAASGRFDWLYSIRVLATAAVVWWYRREYLRVALPISLWGFAAGIGIAAGAGWALLGSRFPQDTGPLSLAGSLSETGRWVWLLFRAVGALAIAPLAEELAFRGCLMRRIRSPHFEEMNPRQAGWLGLSISSLAFGLMHGHRWIEGTAAGFLYGYVYSKNGRLGDAILAHAVTNLVLLIVVAATGNWSYW